MKKHKNAVEVLQCARSILAKRGAWTQDNYAETRDGEWTDVESEEAQKFCMLGALRKCEGGTYNSPKYIAACNRLAMVCGGNVADFNDKPGRKKSEVLAMFDKAIKAKRG